MFAHFLSYLDAKGESSSSKKGTAMPLRSWKLKWVWWAQFLSYAPQTLLKCKSFGDTQMILKWIFETSSHLKSTKNQFEFQSILKQSLEESTILRAHLCSNRHLTIMIFKTFLVNKIPSMWLENWNGYGGLNFWATLPKLC